VRSGSNASLMPPSVIDGLRSSANTHLHEYIVQLLSYISCASPLDIGALYASISAIKAPRTRASLRMSQSSALLTSDLAKADKAAEENHTKKYLDDVGEAVDFLDDECLTLDPYAQFYLQNNGAGYAFYMLECIFKKIDAFIDIKYKAYRSPWEYFSNLDSLVKFGRAIEALTERASQGTTEPTIIEQIRRADRSRMRRVMLKRITDLEPCRRTFNHQVFDNLIDRNSIFDDFLKVIYIKRTKKQNADISGKKNNFSGMCLSF
jgi:hypothetical protein